MTNLASCKKPTVFPPFYWVSEFKKGRKRKKKKKRKRFKRLTVVMVSL